MAADSVASLNKARQIGITWMILCLGGAVAVGYFGLAYFTEEILTLRMQKLYSLNYPKSCLTLGLSASYYLQFLPQL